MARFTIDWSDPAIGLDSSNTISSSGATFGFTVATPPNPDGREWGIGSFNDGSVGLQASSVDDETFATITFDGPVENASFELFDIDARLDGNPSGRWDDKVTVIARDADGNIVDVDFSDLATHHSVDGNTVDSNDNTSNGAAGSGATDSVTVNIVGPIVSLQIIYDNDGGPEISGVVGVSDISFDTIVDGYVEGSSGNDVIDASYVNDPDGDRINAGDAILPGEGANDDIVLAGGGDDIVASRSGDDLVFGGAGSDEINAGGGNDIIYGDSPTNDGPLDFNDLTAGDILDQQFLENGVRISSLNDANPVMVFDTDNPTGGDSDLGTTTNGNVLILSEDGDAGDPDDNASGGVMVFDFTSPATVNSLDLIDQGTGTIIRLYDEDGTLLSTINVPDGADNTVFAQNINVSGVSRMEVDFTGSGAVDNLDFTISNATTGDADILRGGSGNDIIYGQQGNDDLRGGSGNDELFGGVGNDIIRGNAGNDTITGGEGADDLRGGTGSDVFLGGTTGDIIIGGEDDDDSDIDTLDLRGAGIRGIVYQATDPEAGVVTFLDGSTMSFSEIENVIPCFTPGTGIATPKGEVLVENLKVGSRVLTRDNGIKTINWVGQKRLDHLQLKKFPELRPIQINKGALGPDMPDRDMQVSPMHRMLVVSEVAQLHFGQSEFLVPAKHLLAIDGVEVAQSAYVTYIHFMCDHHEIVLSNGAWSESFQPGDYSLKGLDSDQREELFALFPDLATSEGVKAYRAARPTLNKHEAALVFGA